LKGSRVLRISVTDRCNLRCVYCMPESGVQLARAEELLSYEEIELVAKSAFFAGIKRFRITGGEPLVRKGIVSLVEKLARLNPSDLALTTNGILLKEFAHPLKQAGLKRVTISMDTLRKERFEKITRRDDFEKVFDAIESARRAGLEPVKINTVVIRGINDDEVLDFVRFAEKERMDVRFIELMPMSGLETICKEIGTWRSSLLVKGNEIRERIEQEIGPLVPADDGEGVARIFLTSSGARIGFITPVSERFCAGCQRLRLGPDGKLRICLFDQKGIDLRKELRERGADEERLMRIFREALAEKEFWDRGEMEHNRSEMYKIGG